MGESALILFPISLSLSLAGLLGLSFCTLKLVLFHPYRESPILSSYTSTGAAAAAALEATTTTANTTTAPIHNGLSRVR